MNGWMDGFINSATYLYFLLIHQYCLRYESQYLLELGQAMDYLLQFALSMAVQETLKYTILAGKIRVRVKLSDWKIEK